MEDENEELSQTRMEDVDDDGEDGFELFDGIQNVAQADGAPELDADGDVPGIKKSLGFEKYKDLHPEHEMLLFFRGWADPSIRDNIVENILKQLGVHEMSR